ncbi:hypothetical protein FXF51_11705 [Nonomuraea sp. PA05]|nr:hypothetical protein FXF51_11705 [Nonomuraea sp. PA05]
MLPATRRRAGEPLVMRRCGRGGPPATRSPEPRSTPSRQDTLPAGADHVSQAAGDVVVSPRLNQRPRLTPLP